MGMNLEKFIFKHISQYEYPSHLPPLDHRRLEIKDDRRDMVAYHLNDGSEVWIGTPDNWHTHMRNNAFRKICFWYLRNWIFTDWFGLRSFIYYKLLTRSCNRNRIGA